ncbi:MAG: hypothetical protein ACP5L5_08105 [Vulcanisaeta sp.]|uniref:hypothetical protein n=1 Tax=Thermoproteaceae TaxID=2267 RepID=UPI003D0EA160
MRSLRRRSTNEDEDEEIIKLIRRISNKPRFRIEGGVKPSKDAVKAYVSNGLKLLEQTLRELGASEGEVKNALGIGKKTLINNYPTPIDINELAKQLLTTIRTHQNQHRS